MHSPGRLGPLTWAKVVLPKVIASKLVLQRGADAPIWGWTDQSEAISVIVVGQTKKGMPDVTGKWMEKRDPIRASSKPRAPWSS